MFRADVAGDVCAEVAVVVAATAAFINGGAVGDKLPVTARGRAW